MLGLWLVHLESLLKKGPWKHTYFFLGRDPHLNTEENTVCQFQNLPSLVINTQLYIFVFSLWYTSCREESNLSLTLIDYAITLLGHNITTCYCESKNVEGDWKIIISKCKAFQGLAYPFYNSPMSTGTYFHLTSFLLAESLRITSFSAFPSPTTSFPHLTDLTDQNAAYLICKYSDWPEEVHQLCGSQILEIWKRMKNMEGTLLSFYSSCQVN